MEKLQMNIRARFKNYRQGFSSWVWALAALIVIPTTDMGSAEIPAAAAVKQPQRVLMLYSDERLLPANIILDEAIRATFAKSTRPQVEFYSEFLDRARFPGEAQEQRQRDFVRDKYQERVPGSGDCFGRGGGRLPRKIPC